MSQAEKNLLDIGRSRKKSTKESTKPTKIEVKEEEDQPSRAQSRRGTKKSTSKSRSSSNAKKAATSHQAKKKKKEEQKLKIGGVEYVVEPISKMLRDSKGKLFTQAEVQKMAEEAQQKESRRKSSKKSKGVEPSDKVNSSRLEDEDDDENEPNVELGADDVHSSFLGASFDEESQRQKKK